MDSGASSHVTNDANNMQNKQEYHGKETLTVGNSEKLNIYHIGLVKLSVEKRKCLILKETYMFLTLRKI